jgi:5-methyltetrahydrofolate--homocysteine methyltransferase
MINSITEEPERLEEFLPLVVENKTKIVALCMGASAAPSRVEDRLDIARRLVETLTGVGVPLDDIYIDSGIFPVSSAPDQALAALETFSRVTKEFPGVHTIGGMSNVSFGLPLRKLLNSIFLTMAMSWGLDSAIMDPCDRQLMASIAAAEALLGRDEYCAKYLSAYRQGKLESQ